MKIVFVVLFRFKLISSGAQSGRSGIFCIRGSLLLFCFCSSYIYVLCEVAIVSQFFIPFLFSTWDV